LSAPATPLNVPLHGNANRGHNYNSDENTLDGVLDGGLARVVFQEANEFTHG
jgi:hypothetical protein